ncbi:hypothetical protein DESC_720404 [Desulfosarcina cetonica]|uniref:hypothetical protein n=1 Tax=Desulfosarcina cetonica TaxID=90730 RepID=UPI0006D0F5A8|nr:hypothetical protein [Desulfosarcina cetonica]VTR69026.1 hypothetical protein DESC_720404 [Desulfosarcina cetonica]
MSGDPFRSLPLNTGLILNYFDQSKKIAADSWYVCIWVEIEIPVNKKWFGNYHLDDMKFDKIRQALGDRVCFRHKNERNFVSNHDKERIVNDICDRVAKMGTTYFCHPDFAAKYILKCFNDKINRRY